MLALRPAGLWIEVQRQPEFGVVGERCEPAAASDPRAFLLNQRDGVLIGARTPRRFTPRTLRKNVGSEGLRPVPASGLFV
jgi:hypothetical protein